MRQFTPLQNTRLDVDDFIAKRPLFTDEEWLDLLAEIFAELRRRNFQTHVNAWVDMGDMTGRNQDAIKKTAAGMLKLLYPHRTVEELRETEIAPIIEFAVEMRRRTTDQLAQVLPAEFSNIDYSYKLQRSV